MDFTYINRNIYNIKYIIDKRSREVFVKDCKEQIK